MVKHVNCQEWHMFTAYKNLTLAIVRFVNAPRQQNYEHYRHKYLLKPTQKAELLEAGRLVVERRLAQAGTGEISLRLSSDQLASNARHRDLARLDDEQLLITSLEQTGPAAPRHLAWHQAVYAGTAAQGVVLGQPPYTLVLAHSGLSPLEVIAPEIAEAIGGITLLSGSEATTEALPDLASHHHALIVPQVGALVWGSSLPDAVARLEALEYLCQLTALSRLNTG